MSPLDAVWHIRSDDYLITQVGVRESTPLEIELALRLERALERIQELTPNRYFNYLDEDEDDPVPVAVPAAPAGAAG